jgi:hypothetical protein
LASALWLTAVLIITLSLNLVSIVHAQEKTTFQDCTIDTLLGFLVSIKITPNNSEQVKQLASNMCNFYHEKTGIWITHTDWFKGDLQQKYGNEFYQKYKDSFPQELLSLFH